MTTPRDICNSALKAASILGIGQTANAEDINDTFTELKRMVAQWQRKRWLVYHLVDVSIVSTGAQSYTIGPAGNINLAVRPDKIQAGFFRQIVNSSPNQVDYPLKIIESREVYDRISLKALSTFPEWLFYDSAYPLGVLYPWPVPQASIYELHFTIKDILQRFTSLTETIVLPEEYEAALEWNLARRLLQMYGQPARQDLNDLAKESLNVIRMANVQISRLQVPPELTRGGIYNPYSDRDY